jgi:hypothetical protein
MGARGEWGKWRGGRCACGAWARKKRPEVEDGRPDMWAPPVSEGEKREREARCARAKSGRAGLARTRLAQFGRSLFCSFSFSILSHNF